MRAHRRNLVAFRMRLSVLLLAVDAGGIFLACLLGSMIHFQAPLSPPNLTLFALVLPVYLGVAINNDAFAAQAVTDLRAGFSRAAMAFLFAIFVLLFLTYYLKVDRSLSRFGTGLTVVAALGTLVTGRVLVRAAVQRRAGLRLTNDLLITDGTSVEALPGMLALDTRQDDLVPDTRDPHMLDRLGQALRHIDRVLIACPPERRLTWALLLKGSGVDGHVLVDEFDSLGAVGIGDFFGNQTLAVSHAPLDLRRSAAKRLLDLMVTVPGLLFLAPLLILVAIAIKLDSRGSVFFLQPRVGRGNRIFLAFKFRSMRADRTDAAGAQSTRRDDDRITRVGRFIRATSIDELPQLLNVMRGEMSLVGPRPHALGSLAGGELFWDVDERYWHRHACKPGLTGLAQVRGHRGETRLREDLANRLEADLEYLNGWTIWRDLSILLGTLRVIMHRNAY